MLEITEGAEAPSPSDVRPTRWMSARPGSEATRRSIDAKKWSEALKPRHSRLDPTAFKDLVRPCRRWRVPRESGMEERSQSSKLRHPGPRAGIHSSASKWPSAAEQTTRREPGGATSSTIWNGSRVKPGMTKRGWRRLVLCRRQQKPRPTSQGTFKPDDGAASASTPGGFFQSGSISICVAARMAPGLPSGRTAWTIAAQP